MQHDKPEQDFITLRKKLKTSYDSNLVCKCNLLVNKKDNLLVSTMVWKFIARSLEWPIALSL